MTELFTAGIGPGIVTGGDDAVFVGRVPDGSENRLTVKCAGLIPALAVIRDTGKISGGAVIDPHGTGDTG